MSTHALDRTAPFDALQLAFTALTDPQLPGNPLTISFTGVAGLPARPVTLPELRSRLLHPATPYAARDTALNELLRRVQASRNVGSPAADVWGVALCGVLLPGLRRAVWPLTRAYPQLAADLQVEALIGVLTAATISATDGSRVAARLTWAARRHADVLLRGEVGELAVPTDVLPAATHLEQNPVPVADGEPEDVLTAAVTAGVLRAEDAELIRATRLDGVPLVEFAARLGVGYKAVGKRRERAERALVAWLHDPSALPTETPAMPAGGGCVAPAAREAIPSRGGRPGARRQRRRSEECHPITSPGRR